MHGVTSLRIGKVDGKTLHEIKSDPIFFYIPAPQMFDEER